MQCGYLVRERSYLQTPCGAILRLMVQNCPIYMWTEKNQLPTELWFQKYKFILPSHLLDAGAYLLKLHFLNSEDDLFVQKPTNIHFLAQPGFQGLQL